MRNKNNSFVGVFLALSAYLLSLSCANAGALQIVEPQSSVNPNLGDVDGAQLSATSAGNRWVTSASALNTTLYSRTDLFGTNAAEPGTVGDFFAISMSGGTTDTFTITLLDDLTDATLYVTDIDLIGGSVTVPAGATNPTANADGEWNGLTLTSLSGAPQETTGAFGAVFYPGTLTAGTDLVFDVDFTGVTSGSDFIGLGIAVPNVIPVPPALLLFGSALGALGWLRRRCSRGAWQRQ